MPSIRQKRIVLFSLLSMIGIISVTFVLPQKSYAAYNGGRIVDDKIFLDANSMSKSDIQNFLVDKGSGLKDKKFTLYCSGTSSQERRLYLAAGATCDTDIPASEIIYYAAQIYGLNPQVILATIQKEQSLVTDPDPSDTQLKQAMGYACPDSGSCSSSSTFGYQIDNGTWALRYHFERARGNMTWWYTSTSWTCGSKKNYYSPSLYPNQNVNFYDDNGTLYATIYIQNAATSSLYCYTPHAYNNPQGLYGRAVFGTTGMYYSGSYNFVTAFEAWFGSTHIADYHWSPISQFLYSDASQRVSIANDSFVANHSQRIYLTVKVQNDGNATWYKNSVFLGTSNPNDRNSIIYDSTWISRNRPATLNEDSVAPGAYGTFSFWANSPNTVGLYKEYFNLLKEGTTWMNDMGLYFQFNVLPQVFSYAVTQQDAYADSTMSTKQDMSNLVVGERVYMHIVVRNSGNVAWSASNTNLGTSNARDRSSSFFDPTWVSRNRPAHLTETTVNPGQTASFNFWLKPSVSGQYNEYFNLVVEGISWMNDIGMYYPLTVNKPTYVWSPSVQAAYTDNSRTNTVDLANLQRGQRFYLYMRIQNTGNTTWYKDNVNMATSAPRDRSSVFYDDSWMSKNRLVNLSEASVKPGEYGTFGTWVRAPSQTGNYKEYFNFVSEGTAWLNDIGLYYPFVVK